MSSTRSRSPRAPATDPGGTGVLLVGHGSTTRPESGRSLKMQAEALAATGRFAHVAFGVFNGGPSPDDVLSRMTGLDRVLVLPFFMSNGFLVSHLLRQRLSAVPGGVGLHFCPAFGLCPEAADLAVRISDDIAQKAGWPPSDTVLLLAAHGSMKGPASRLATDALARRVSRRTRFRTTRTAYLEQAPGIAQTVAELDRPAIVLGLFAGNGVHAAVDVPRALGHAQHPIRYSGAIGCHDQAVDVLYTVLERESGRADAAC